MTEQELYNHPEFKLIKKILKKEFKWIKDVKLDGDPNRYDSLIFLEVFVDPFEFIEEFKLTPATYLRRNKPLRSSALSIFTEEPYEHPITHSLMKEIEKVPDQVHRTPALPEEFKLKNIKFNIHHYAYQP